MLVDGNRIPSNLDLPAQAVVKGDSLVAEISAASILAKVARDQEMEDLDKNILNMPLLNIKVIPPNYI